MSHAGINSKRVAEMNRLRGVSAQARGNASEELVLEAALSAKDRIPGVLGARLKTDEEDRRGVDVVVETVDGPVLLQVKSSHAEAKRSRAARRGLLNAPRILVAVACFDRARMERRVESAIRRGRRQPARPLLLTPRQARRAKNEARLAAEAAAKMERAHRHEKLLQAHRDGKGANVAGTETTARASGLAGRAT